MCADSCDWTDPDGDHSGEMKENKPQHQTQSE